MVSMVNSSAESARAKAKSWRSTRPRAQSNGRKNCPRSAYGASTLANDVVFTTTFNGTLYALDTTTGKELWKTKLSAGHERAGGGRR